MPLSLSRRLGFVVLAVSSLALASFLTADPAPEPGHLRLAQLIKKLGSEHYHEREAAHRDLEQEGEPALALLRTAADKNDDPEVRMRAHRIARLILWNARKCKSLDLELVPVSAQEFTMGSPNAESNRRVEEKQHPVRLERAFLLGVHEITQEEYRTVTKTSPSWFASTGGGEAKVKGLDTKRFPVENVTWYDALEFCNLLSKMDGYDPHYQLDEVKRDKDAIVSAKVTLLGGNGYRLPTEAEWECACRAGWNRPFHYGNYGTGKQANCKPDPSAGGYGGPPSWAPLNRTTEVGSYKANGWNLYDMHGNAGEWCWDWYDRDYYANSPPRNPAGPATGTQRVVRGGSWMVSEGSCRSASRMGMAPDERKEYVGFRIARTP